jgi:hypothetical protein
LKRNSTIKFLDKPEVDVKPGVKRKYTSRRSRTFDDDDSCGDEKVAPNRNIEWTDSQNHQIVLTPNQRLLKYYQIFTSLLRTDSVVTDYDIINMIISYDSQRAISVQKKEDNESYIVQYSIQTRQKLFEEKIGGGENDQVKVKEVRQNAEGTKYAVCYYINGEFRMRVFSKEQRSQDFIEKSEINFNKIFGLDDFTIPIYEFPDPYITCCFIDDQ